MMLTRCPTCATAFRVTPEQLKVKNGKVRCGQCQNIFNALDSLLDAAREEPVTQPESAPAEVINEGWAYEALDTPQEPSPETSSAEPAAPESPVVLASKPATELDSPPALPTAPLPEQVEDIEPLLHEESAPQRHGWLWALAAFMASVLLLFQAVVQFRVELAVVAPETKPALQALCSLLGCDLPLPRKISLLGIEASDLHPDTQDQDRLVLTTTLKNRAPFAQTLPHLELTLTDTADQPMLRKILTPADYLPKTMDMSAGFVANSEIAVNLLLIAESSDNATAAGYQLYLFYP